MSASFMTLAESLFWKRWGIGGIADWQVNWVELTILGAVTNRGGDGGPKASWMVIANHLIHGMAASVVFVVLLSAFQSWPPSAGVSIVLDALVYSILLWVVFSVFLRRFYERAGGIRILRRGILVSLLSHFVYGLSLGLLVGTYVLATL